jgi:hypothetical protein
MMVAKDAGTVVRLRGVLQEAGQQVRQEVQRCRSVCDMLQSNFWIITALQETQKMTTRHILACALLLAGSNALAQSDKDLVNVRSGLREAEIGGEFRTELAWDNDGINKEWEKDAPTTKLSLKALKLNLKGRVHSNVDWNLKLNLLAESWPHSKSEGLLEQAWAAWQVFPTGKITIGRTQIKQGGWSSIDDNWRAIWGKSPIVMPFNKYGETLSFGLKVAGELTLQLTNDVTTSSGPDDSSTPVKEGDGTTASAGQWNKKRKQPAVLVEYKGEFGPIQPLLQIGQYDLNHSRYISFGAKAVLGESLTLVADWFRDDRSQKVLNAAGTKHEDKALTFTNISARVQWKLAGITETFLWWNKYTRSGEKDAFGAATDVAVNSVDPTSGSWSWDDNSQQISVGAWALGWGDAWLPWTAVRHQSGKFTGKEGTDKTLAQLSVAAGVASKF